ncbi:hypothetical protein Hanom_Chr12g01110241 [Helianthus anomalus]
MKSIRRRPSLLRPAGEWKKVWPLGGGSWPKTADKPPVSEFESPKLNTAGKLHSAGKQNVDIGSSSSSNNNVTPITSLQIGTIFRRQGERERYSQFKLPVEQTVSYIGIGLKFIKLVYFRYQFCTDIHRFLPSNTGTVPVPTGTEPYHTRYIRYRYPLLGISVTVFSVPVDTELIKSCSNAAMQVIAPPRLLFIHTVSKLYFV